MVNASVQLLAIKFLFSTYFSEFLRCRAERDKLRLSG
jgi:hypothetical protein